MSVSNRIRFSFACLLLGVAVTGCGRAMPAGETGTVKGRLTIDGAAAPEGTTVVLTHSTENHVATGVVKGDGYFSMRFRDGTKVVTGLYGVSVTPPTDSGAGMSMDSEEYQKMMMSGGNAPPPPEAPFPERYLQPSTSGEEFQVDAGDNELNLDLKKS